MGVGIALFSLSLCVRLSVCLVVSFTACFLEVCLGLRLCDSVPVCVFYLFVCVSVFPSVCLSVCLRLVCRSSGKTIFFLNGADFRVVRVKK